jgi:hypothetical protein
MHVKFLRQVPCVVRIVGDELIGEGEVSVEWDLDRLPLVQNVKC